MIHIDARTLSIRQLRDARKFSWCVNHNENMRPPGNIPDEKWYGEDDFNRVINFIINNGILKMADNIPQRVSGSLEGFNAD